MRFRGATGKGGEGGGRLGKKEDPWRWKNDANIAFLLVEERSLARRLAVLAICFLPSESGPVAGKVSLGPEDDNTNKMMSNDVKWTERELRRPQTSRWGNSVNWPDSTPEGLKGSKERKGQVASGTNDK